MKTAELAGPALMAGAITVGTYLRVIRPWQLRWGATDTEITRSMPGDDVVAHPTFNATRAVTVDAPPDAIWPWLVQIGYRRAGWYAYDWIDNLRLPTRHGLRPWQPSAQSIIPELQHVAVGDFYPQGPGESSGLWVRAYEPNQWMLWADKRDNATWLWVLDPVDPERTRLITRVRIHYEWTSPWILFNLPLDVGDIVMMRKCLLGIKRRAEAFFNQTTTMASSAATSQGKVERTALNPISNQNQSCSAASPPPATSVTGR